MDETAQEIRRGCGWIHTAIIERDFQEFLEAYDTVRDFVRHGDGSLVRFYNKQTVRVPPQALTRENSIIQSPSDRCTFPSLEPVLQY